MKATGKIVTSGLAVAILLMSANNASAVTWELSGKLSVEHTQETPQDLLALADTRFTTYLTYNEEASPTSILSSSFVNYANEGHFAFNTILGSASGNLENLQTFIFNGLPAEGSNFNGASFNLTLTGSLSSLALVPISFGFQFQRSPWGENPGLTSFALPHELNLQNFDGFNFVRVTFSSAAGLPKDASLTGVIDSVSAVPEPQTYMMMLAGLGLLGWRIRKANE